MPPRADRPRPVPHDPAPSGAPATPPLSDPPHGAGDVTAEVRAQIDAHARLVGAHVDVELVDGEVVITGTVTSAVAKHRVGEVARATPGVGAVRNRLVTVLR